MRTCCVNIRHAHSSSSTLDVGDMTVSAAGCQFLAGGVEWSLFFLSMPLQIFKSRDTPYQYNSISPPRMSFSIPPTYMPTAREAERRRSPVAASARGGAAMLARGSQPARRRAWYFGAYYEDMNVAISPWQRGVVRTVTERRRNNDACRQRTQTQGEHNGSVEYSWDLVLCHLTWQRFLRVYYEYKKKSYYIAEHDLVRPAPRPPCDKCHPNRQRNVAVQTPCIEASVQTTKTMCKRCCKLRGRMNTVVR